MCSVPFLCWPKYGCVSGSEGLVASQYMLGLDWLHVKHNNCTEMVVTWLETSYDAGLMPV